MTNNHKLVSIIVPIYNAEHYIETCINSLLSQTYRHIEIILVNDGSTDRSSQVLQTFKANPVITIIEKNNAGVSSARNCGIDAAKGDFLIFVDADDYLEKNAIEELVNTQDTSGADIVIMGFRNFGYNPPEKDTLIFPKSILLQQNDIIEYVKNYLNRPNKHSLFVYSWGRLFKTDKIKSHDIRFDESLSYYEDVLFNFDALTVTNSIFYLSKPLYNFQRHQMKSSATTKLTGDPQKFFTYPHALKSAKNYMLNHCSNKGEIEQWYGNACITYTIIQLIRLCGNITLKNFNNIKRYISALIKEKWLRTNLHHYRPQKGDSRIIPKLISSRQTLLIMWVCYKKAHKRYG